jgi:hypothetical protein
MSTVLGLLGLLAFIVCVIAFAAGVTWTVVKLSPLRDKPKPEPEPTQAP